ncbi:MAG TPA: acyl-CoA dehydrogenase family protein [Candidatus Deferrimicrobiaceae bacterium]|nr:acyl-CoA dehydrogenase family protein [Candidatus Deferrimicrobiaceae bacterium]
MNFDLTPGQRRWQELARDFARRVLGPGADAWDEAGRYPLAAFREAAGLGLAGMFAPAVDGGQQLDGLTGSLVLEQLAQGCFATTFGLVVHNNFVRSLARGGTRAARARWLGALTRGELLGGFALTELGAGTDAAAIGTTATREPGGYRLDGVKAWVTNGSTADLYNVMARTTPLAAGARSSADGISSIVVERDRPGVSFGPPDRVTAARALPTCEMRLDGVRVPADHLLGREGDGLRAALATIDLARAQVGAIATGLAQGALDEAVGYARERRAFGRAIAEFQGLQFLLADLAAQVEAARWLAYRAAWLFDQGQPATRACAIAKRVGVDAAEEVARKALEVFGASGLRRDRPVERYLRWAKVTAFIDGTPQVQQLVIARDLFRAR